MAKKAIITGLLACLLSTTASPAFAITGEEAECPLADVKPEGELVKTAYAMFHNGGEDVSMNDSAHFTLEVSALVDPCTAKYNWNEDIASGVQDYTVGSMAQVGAIVKMAELRVDIKPINAELAAANDSDWDAMKAKDPSSRIYERLTALLVAQGFDPDQNLDVYRLLGEYIGIALFVREAKTKLQS
jgi:hypothetical protein